MVSETNVQLNNVLHSSITVLWSNAKDLPETAVDSEIQ